MKENASQDPDNSAADHRRGWIADHRLSAFAHGLLPERGAHPRMARKTPWSRSAKGEVLVALWGDRIRSLSPRLCLLSAANRAPEGRTSSSSLCRPRLL